MLRLTELTKLPEASRALVWAGSATGEAMLKIGGPALGGVPSVRPRACCWLTLEAKAVASCPSRSRAWVRSLSWNWIRAGMEPPAIEFPACHLAQQDWGVPVRITPGAPTTLTLPLLG